MSTLLAALIRAIKHIRPPGPFMHGDEAYRACRCGSCRRCRPEFAYCWVIRFNGLTKQSAKQAVWGLTVDGERCPGCEGVLEA